MKSVHLTNAWHETSGGISTFYRALIEAANRNRHELRLIVPGEETRIEEKPPYCRIYHLKSPTAPFNSAYRWILPYRYLLPWGDVNRILREERPDVVEICEKYVLPYLGGLIRRGWLAGLAFRPAVIGLSMERLDDNLKSYLPAMPSGVAEAFCRFYMKWLYFPFFDHHITISPHTAAELRDASLGHDIERGVWIRSLGVGVNQFRPDRRTTRAAQNSRLLVYAGRLAPEKNLKLLVETMAILAGHSELDFRLVVAGAGMERERLETALARVCPGRARFVGHLNHAELADLYAGADAFVHPNAAEPFGIAPLEAMAAGLALVAPAQGGVLTYAGPHNAWLAEPTPAAFASAVIAATTDSEDRQGRLRAARETAERFAWPAVADGYLALYEQIQRCFAGQKRIEDLAPDFRSTAATPVAFVRRLRAEPPR
jgi:alpha-1,6-mannosyltransferase